MFVMEAALDAAALDTAALDTAAMDARALDRRAGEQPVVEISETLEGGAEGAARCGPVASFARRPSRCASTAARSR